MSESDDSGAHRDFAGPDFSAPARPPQSASPPATGPAQQQPSVLPTRPGRPPLAVILIGLAMVLAVVGTVVILVARPVGRSAISSTPTASRPTSASAYPSTISKPPAGMFGEAMTATGLFCVESNAEPVINDCVSNPSATPASVRWINDDRRMTGFEIYGRAKTADDLQVLHDRIRFLHFAGPSRSDATKIIKNLPKSRQAATTVTVPIGWGVVSIRFSDSTDSFRLIGDQAGSKARYPGRVFGGTQQTITDQLARRAFDCDPDSLTLTCTAREATVRLYRSASNDAFNVLEVEARDGAARYAVEDLLPILLGAEAGPISSMISANQYSPIFIGAFQGRLVQVTPDRLWVTCVSW